MPRQIPFERLDSEASMKRWNEGKILVALAHPASTGHGLNLQDGGNIICWFSPIWSLELYQQTNARLFRQGQKASTVVVMHKYRLPGHDIALESDGRDRSDP